MRLVRKSFGRQIAEALDDYKDKTPDVVAWTFEPGANDAMKYVLWYSDHSVMPLIPGEMANWLNARGYAIEFGRTH